VIAAVIDGRAFRNIENDCRLGTGRGVTICIRGLRDYAARSGEVTTAPPGNGWTMPSRASPSAARSLSRWRGTRLSR